MSKPNLLAIWAKHERGEGATNEELGHLIERFESLQDRLEQAEREAKAGKGVITQHIAERSLEMHHNVGIAVDEAVKAVVQLLIEDPSRRAREAEQVVAKVRELADDWETRAMRWEHPLPVPKGVSQIREVLGVPTHDPDWEDCIPSDGPSCSCGYNGTPKECWVSRRALDGEKG